MERNPRQLPGIIIIKINYNKSFNSHNSNFVI
jgi:hypothetical protein